MGALTIVVICSVYLCKLKLHVVLRRGDVELNQGISTSVSLCLSRKLSGYLCKPSEQSLRVIIFGVYLRLTHPNTYSFSKLITTSFHLDRIYDSMHNNVSSRVRQPGPLLRNKRLYRQDSSLCHTFAHMGTRCR